MSNTAELVLVTGGTMPRQRDACCWPMRLKLAAVQVEFGELARRIKANGGEIGTVTLVSDTRESQTLDCVITAPSVRHSQQIVRGVRDTPGVQVLDTADPTFHCHLGGKIEIRNKVPVKTRTDLAMAYTPGFAHVAAAISRNPEEVYRFSIKGNAVAIVTDGTAVSGLGDIGPNAALPVMEGKALLFKEFAGIDAFPICLATKDVDEIINVVKCIEPAFGAIMLEDISAPRCFEIEDRLREELTIPVLHDDQHATAVAATAALTNAAKVVGKKPRDLKIVIAGAGAAGTSSAKLFMQIGVRNIIACDRQGAIHRGRTNVSRAKRWFADYTNPGQQRGSLSRVIAGADVFLGLSAPGVITVEDIKSMARDPIVFALANPVPEILPDQVYDVAAVFATGRSDYPNQIDCGLCYPGIFRGALDCRARTFNDAMKLAAAHAIAGMVDDASLDKNHIVPDIFDGVAPRVARAVMRAAIDSKVAQASVTASSPTEESPP